MQARLARTELADPTVVRLRVGLRQRRVLHLGLPQQTHRGVEDGGVDVLGVEDPDPLGGVHRAERRLGADTSAPGSFCIAGRSGAPIAPSVDGEAVAAHGIERCPSISSSSRPFSSIEEAQRAVAELRVDVLLPQRRWFEDVAIDIDGAVLGDGVRFVDRLGRRQS